MKKDLSPHNTFVDREAKENRVKSKDHSTSFHFFFLLLIDYITYADLMINSVKKFSRLDSGKLTVSLGRLTVSFQMVAWQSPSLVWWFVSRWITQIFFWNKITKLNCFHTYRAFVGRIYIIRVFIKKILDIWLSIRVFIKNYKSILIQKFL